MLLDSRAQNKREGRLSTNHSAAPVRVVSTDCDSDHKVAAVVNVIIPSSATNVL